MFGCVAQIGIAPGASPQTLVAPNAEQRTGVLTAVDQAEFGAPGRQPGGEAMITIDGTRQPNYTSTSFLVTAGTANAVWQERRKDF